MAVGCVGGNRRRGRGFRIGRRRRVVTGRARRAAGEKGQQGERGDRFHRAILGGCGRWKKKIGRASCRERVCQYVSISVVAVSLKQNEQSTCLKKICKV